MAHERLRGCTSGPAYHCCLALLTLSLFWRAQVVMAHERHKGVGRALCKNAAELQATMVVLGGHKKSKVEEMLMGSTSKYVAFHCTQPVLVLH